MAAATREQTPPPLNGASPTGLAGRAAGTRLAGVAGLTGSLGVVPAPGPVPLVIDTASEPRTDELPLVPPPPVVERRPAEPAPALDLRPAIAGAAPTGGTWAVVIGIDDYPGTGNDLKSAVNDADDMVTALAGLGVPAEHRLVLRNRQATADGIRGALDWLIARSGEDALAVLFFSGHVRKLGPSTEALVGADGAVLADDELAERLGALAARQAWVAVAGCYGGGFTEVLAPGRVLTGAAPADALAFESSLYNRSYLGQFMIREALIEGRAPGSVQAAFAYANRQLALRHPGRQLVQFDLLGTALDLRPLTRTLAPPGPPPTAAPAPPPAATKPRSCLLLILCAG
ncbi:MAG TPA: caspase family protein [Acidimicrobiales bacterium]|nr:caspase family protein [Acidimicrobiales bacterium]